MLTVPGPDWTAAHRRVWAQKPVLHLIYGRWFQRLYAACAAEQPSVELGCGPGFFKERYPNVVATDVGYTPYADVVFDATAMPFADGTIGSIVFVDVFHHLPQPVQSLREAARVLRTGGRVAMIEPWLGFAGQVLFRYLHHEDCDASVDPGAPWPGTTKAAMEGNAALPQLYFGRGGYLEQLRLPFTVIAREPFPALPWVLSGGFQSFSLLPQRLLTVAERLDRVAALLPALTATRCLVVLEKSGS